MAEMFCDECGREMTFIEYEANHGLCDLCLEVIE